MCDKIVTYFRCDEREGGGGREKDTTGEREEGDRDTTREREGMERDTERGGRERDTTRDRESRGG